MKDILPLAQGLQQFAKTLFLALAIQLSFLSFAYAQDEVKVSGTVTSDSGEPLPGVNILEKGTSRGVISDIDGNFAISISKNAVLTFSYIGFKAQEVAIGDQTSFNIILEADLEQLDEVVVIGYGTQKKSDLTGSIVGVDSKTVTERGVTNPVQSLQGSVAGVQVSNSTGRVGDSFDVTIRGKSTLGSNNSPLFVVDGVIVDNIDFLNPQDIAKMDILKDASSSAIYGSRGANGVIIIQTKGGVHVPSGTSVSFDAFYGFKDPARLPKMMSYEKWRDYHLSAYVATVNSNTVTNPDEFYDAVVSPSSNRVLRRRFEELDGFDWYDAVLKTGHQSNNYLTINHRNGGSSYNIGLGYQNETGNIDNEGLDKYTFRTSINQELSDKFMTGGTVSVSQSTIERGSSNGMRQAFRLSPFLHPWSIDENDEDIIGDLFPQPGKLTDVDGQFVVNKTSTYNPLLEIANSRDETKQWNVITNAFLKYQPLEWLSFRTAFSGGLKTYKRGKSWTALTEVGSKNENKASSEVSNFTNFNFSWDNQVDINKEFGDHKISALLLHSIFETTTETSFASSKQQPFDTQFYNVGSGIASTYNLGSNFYDSRLLSFAARVNYAFKGKYLITVSNRWDGASVLAEGHKWESFPSAAIAWKLNEEGFLSGTTALTDLKLRLSYGTTGNNSVSPYTTLNTLNQQTYYDFDGTAANGWVSSSIANKALTWEKTTETNIGVDYGFLNHRIVGSIDYYNRISNDLLVSQKLPSETGFSSITSNAAKVKNSGVELMLTTVNIDKPNFRWETIFTFTKNNNEIQEIYGQSESDDVGNGWFIGQPIDVHYNYQFDGIWQASEAAEAAEYNQSEGQAKVVDVNDDGKIDPNDDRVFLGSLNPDWTGGIISRLQVHNFDFNFTITSNQGVLAYSNFHANFTDMRDRGRQKLDVADWYVPENPYGLTPQASNSYPQGRNGGTYWRNDGVGYYKDASYVKVNNISLGYSFAQPVLDKLKMQQLRVYVNVLNPIVFTDYEGYDPEWADASLDRGGVSSVITQFGLSLKF
ncbi:TonB-dependent receptor [Flammeovirgaceae bacterium SG7u.111]|nr:TonB-dependent receptor [Flammeovirgaceae bacterium SG7u.132]WPO36300.1 TonB-dependent receptor [Flammeovirgaceae bacterium SG7u.111]